VQLATVD